MKSAAKSSLKQTINSLHQAKDYGAFGRLIQHCNKHRLVLEGKQLHARLILSSITPDNFLASKLINFYSKSNLLVDAHRVFDDIPNKNIFSWNAMLIGYCHHGMFSEALSLFSVLGSLSKVGLKPDEFTVSCVLKVLSGLVCGERFGCEVHCYALRHGLDGDLFVVNGLIAYYGKCGKVGLARMLFDRMVVKDVVSWNSMIAGYSQSGFYGECKELYSEMVGSAGLNPDGVTMVSLLQACGQTNDLFLGMEVHQFVNERQMEMGLELCNAVIGMYAKCGSLDYARELFEGMSERDEVTYSSLVSGYMVHGFVDQAMILFREMKQPNVSTWNAVLSGLAQNNRHELVIKLIQEMLFSGFRPNMVTIASILPVFSHYSYLKGGKELHAYAVRHNFEQIIYVATALIDTYAKSGCLNLAQRIFDQSKGRSLIIWTAIISAYAAHGDAYVALRLYHEMLNNGIQPDSVTFTAVLTACVHSGEVDEAWKILDSMSLKYGVQPSSEHYACMVGVLSRAGRLSEAVTFISKMPILPSAKVWGALLNGASVSGNVEMGEYACSHLFEMEPENTGNYVIMANLYSQAGRWKEADVVRERMKTTGLNKIPGSSWIETNRGTQNVITRDITSRKAEDIYEVLEGLPGLVIEKEVS